MSPEGFALPLVLFVWGVASNIRFSNFLFLYFPFRVHILSQYAASVCLFFRVWCFSCYFFAVVTCCLLSLQHSRFCVSRYFAPYVNYFKEPNLRSSYSRNSFSLRPCSQSAAVEKVVYRLDVAKVRRLSDMTILFNTFSHF